MDLETPTRRLSYDRKWVGFPTPGCARGVQVPPILQYAKRNPPDARWGYPLVENTLLQHQITANYAGILRISDLFRNDLQSSSYYCLIHGIRNTDALMAVRPGIVIKSKEKVLPGDYQNLTLLQTFVEFL